MPAKKTKGSSKKVFRDVVAKALEDKTYAKKLKALAIKAKAGDARATQQLMKSFHLTPQQLKKVNASFLGPQAIPITTVTIPITATFLFSCFPRSWKICSEAG